MELTPNWAAMRARYNERFREAGEAEMTQTRLAELMGKDPSEINRYESGARTPELATIVLAASLLHCEPVGTLATDSLFLHADCDCGVTDA